MVANKHSSLASELEKEILTGKYGWEGGLPTASELTQLWKMSINTVKNALSLLEGKGIIEKRGTAYYVNRVPTTMTQYVPQAHVRINNKGYSKTIKTEAHVKLPDHIAQKANVSDMEVVYRLQLSGEMKEETEKPLQITHRYYLLPLTEEKINKIIADENYDPMWNDLETETNLLSHDEIAPRIATDKEAEQLDLPKSTPVNSVIEIIKDEESKNTLIVQELVLSPRSTLIFDYPFKNKK
jgi:DNA-binding GntR family transcriptional regulator